MDNKLFKILKELKEIEPNQDYSRRSRLLIVGTVKEGKNLIGDSFKLFRFAGIKMAAAALALLLIISGSVYYVNQSNEKELMVKANEINNSIQIKLDEIKYILENKPQLNSSDIAAIQTILEETIKELEEASSLSAESKNMEEVLEKIKSAQEDFLKINLMLK